VADVVRSKLYQKFNNCTIVHVLKGLYLIKMEGAAENKLKNLIFESLE